MSQVKYQIYPIKAMVVLPVTLSNVQAVNLPICWTFWLTSISVTNLMVEQSALNTEANQMNGASSLSLSISQV